MEGNRLSVHNGVKLDVDSADGLGAGALVSSVS